MQTTRNQTQRNTGASMGSRFLKTIRLLKTSMILKIGMIALAALSTNCAPKPLSPIGSISIATRVADPALQTSAAALSGLYIEEQQSPDYWLQRYRTGLAAGSTADLYVAEWNHEVFSLVRNGSTAGTAELLKRSATTTRAAAWYGNLKYGPAHGFLPTAVYTWGLFVRGANLDPNLTTLAAFEAKLQEQQAQGRVPIALGTAFGWPGAAWFTMLDLRLNGPEAAWERLEGSRPYNDPGALAVLQRLADWRDKGYFSPNAATSGLVDAIRAVENDSAYCTLLGAFAIERFTNVANAAFMPFPHSGLSSRAELASLTGFLVPASSQAAEAAMAFADAYVAAGSVGHVTDPYRVALKATFKPSKREAAPDLSGLNAIKRTQAVLLADTVTLVPSFDRAVSPQILQDSISLWAGFFAPGGPTPEAFATRLQAIVSRE